MVFGLRFLRTLQLVSGCELPVLWVPHVMVAILVKYLVSELLSLIITFSKGRAPICHTPFIYFHCTE
jgi:hypothetical protein